MTGSEVKRGRGALHPTRIQETSKEQVLSSIPFSHPEEGTSTIKINTILQLNSWKGYSIFKGILKLKGYLLRRRKW
jgi:hypothetical protein